MKIMLICREGNKYILDKATSKYTDVEYIDFVNRTSNTIDLIEYKKAILLHGPDVVYIGLSNLNIDNKKNLEVLNDIYLSRHLKIIIDNDLDYKENSLLINSFKTVNCFILQGNLTQKEEQLLSILNGSNTLDNINIIDSREKEEKYLNEKYNLPSNTLEVTIQKRIAIVGSMPRIGTTTLAMQLIKFLQAQSKRVCYVECNLNGYIDNLAYSYGQEVVDDKFNISNTTLYKGMQSLSQKDYDKYDYVIKDYGDYRGINLNDIASNDVIISIMGLKANEIEYNLPIYKAFNNLNAIYFYNFVEKAKRSVILENQKSISNRTFFLDYAPNSFNLQFENSNTFERMLHILQSKKVIKKDKFFKFIRG